MRSLSRISKTYITLTIAAGVIILAVALSNWRSDHALQFLFYLVSALLVSNMKVKLPGITGSMSVSFIFILIGVTELSLAETVLIGVVGILGQVVCNTAKRPKPIQIVFNVSSITISVACSYWIYHSNLLRRIDSSLPVLLFAASCAYFLVNTASISGVIALTEKKPLWRLWHECFFWTVAQYLVGGALAALVHLGNRYLGWQISLLVLPVAYLLYRSYRIYIGRLEEEKKHVSEMADLHLRTIEALALAIEAKDNTTHDHLQRVKVYANEIGKELGISDIEIQALQAAALLHDIGKLAVPEYIISKPGKLTPEEFEKMKIHPVVGAEILERVKFPYPVVPIVRAHHEKWNGTGYPHGLKGEEIPIGARILAAVDCLDALASDRQYRRALPLDKAMEIVVSESGKSYDPQVVDVLKRRYIELEQMATSAPVAELKLSTNAKIERGEAPAAGFEAADASKHPATREKLDFVSAIASARQEFQLLLEVTNELGKSLSVDETLSLLAFRLKRIIPHDSIAIYVKKEDRLIPQFVNGENFRLFSSLEIPVGHGLSGWVVENKRPMINGNPSVEPGYLNDPSKFSTLRSAISVPLEGLSGVIGALTLYHAEADAFTRDHLRILMAISSRAGLTIQNALKYQQAEKTAVTDELTALPNARSLFLHLDSELARCQRTNTPLTLLVLDLDGFKSVNDRFGHLKGNKVLQLTAKALKDVCREYDYVARMGGDEFVMVLPGIRPDAVKPRTAQIAQVAREAGRQVCGADILSLSIGEAHFPDDGTDAEQLLAEADMRMYQAKQANMVRRQRTLRVEDFDLNAATIQ